MPSIQNPYQYFSSNVIGTFNVIEACKNKDISKFIYAASSSCYGIPKKYPTSEDSKNDPRYPYALTKMLGESILLHYGKAVSYTHLPLPTKA